MYIFWPLSSGDVKRGQNLEAETEASQGFEVKAEAEDTVTNKKYQMMIDGIYMYVNLYHFDQNDAV